MTNTTKLKEKIQSYPMLAQGERATILEKTRGMWKNRLPKSLPKSLFVAAGLLAKKYRELKKHHEKIRKEWPSYRVAQ